MSRFSKDRLGLLLVDDGEGRADTKGGRGQWDTFGELFFETGPPGSGIGYYLGPGERTDLASTPRIAWSVLPPDGPWVKAAVLHDKGYRSKGDIARIGHPALLTRKEVDDLFLEMMTVLGVTPWKRQVIYRAVRAFGAAAWGS